MMYTTAASKISWIVFFCVMGGGLSKQGCAQDWPMWRANAERSAATPHELPEKLDLQWTKSLSPRKQAWDDPLNLDLMTFDRVFEPIVLEGRLFVGFNDQDKLVALDAGTGEELWTLFAEGPVRLPPVGWDGRVFFCSDDGFLYCADAETGELLWKFRGAPNSQHAIGNRRLCSAWPARGGPVVRDGKVYFAASIWPFMGTFIYALDAHTGEVEWVNDNTGAQYIKQPHSAPSFAGVAPQGALVATENDLLVPGGRSVPAVFNRSDGTLRYFELNAGGKGTGGSFLSSDGQHFYVHTRLKGTRAFDLESGLKTAFMPNEPVLYQGNLYSAEIDQENPVVRQYDADQQVVWQVAADGSGDLILAGDKLYAAGADSISVIQLAADGGSASVVQKIPVEGSVQRLVAADRKLFAVTLDGAIHAFGSEGGPAAVAQVPATPRNHENPVPQLLGVEVLSQVDAQGYALWFGSVQDPALRAVVAQSPFVQLAVVDEDAAAIDPLRRELNAAGLYGKITVHHSPVGSFRAPRYVAHAVFVGENVIASVDDTSLRTIYESVRPYGGTLYLLTKSGQWPLAKRLETLDLEQAQVEIVPHGVVVRRVGALPDSANWTHQYGDVANTIKSDDRRVKLPLGILWFGGSSNMDVLPRHGHGPPEQVIGGRLFIQGMNSLSARDVYTGRVLWKREFEDLGTHDVYYDHTYENVPLNPKYNQVHIPGANGRGTNYVATEERVYILEGSVCHALDPATGETREEFRLPQDESGQEVNWGYIGVYQDVLIGGQGFAQYRSRHGLSFEADKQLKSSRAGFGSKSFDRAASAALIGFDRHSGKQLWRVPANHSFWHNGIVAGGDKIYCLDKNPQQVEDAMRRRGKSLPDSYRIAAYDYWTGDLLWEIQEGIFGTWLGYSEEHDLLLQAGASASDRLYAEVGRGMAVYSGSGGALQWRNDSLDYAGPCILHNDLIITNANSYTESAGAFYITTGKQKSVKNPLTGELQPWKVTRAYGCNNIIACENFLTFRSGAAGFFDLQSDSGTGNLGGFKSGCTSNLVVANGVLNAPDYTRTCSCSYQNQTSLALVHMPDIDLWSVNAAAAVESPGQEIEQLAVNFGAPGDRRDADGTLWLEYPVVAGQSPPLSIRLNSGADYYQHHSSTHVGADRPWMASSGIEGVTELSIGVKIAEEFNLKDTGLPIADANDDAEESEQGNVDLGSSDLELVEDDGAQLVGMRFGGLPLAQGAKIRSAFLQFTVDEASEGPTSLLISGEDVGNSSPFNEAKHDLSARTRTSAEVGWKPGPWLKAGEAAAGQRTPDLAKIIQQIVDRPDWKPGNALTLLIGGAGDRVAASGNGQKKDAPRLIIDADTADSTDGVTSNAQKYDVRLHFSTPAHDASPRQFDVFVQNRLVASDLRIPVKGENASSVRVVEVDDVAVNDDLHVRLVPKLGTPVLCGIEFHKSDHP